MKDSIINMSDKWARKEHLVAALKEHLSDASKAVEGEGDFDKEITDLYLISKAYRQSQIKDELIKARLAKFRQTSKYPPLA
jgi:hypothetical protein